VTEAELDQLTGEVFATPAGKRWLEAVGFRSDAPATFLLAEVRARIARMRQRWRTGSLTPP
jgi:hypothetical protein